MTRIIPTCIDVYGSSVVKIMLSTLNKSRLSAAVVLVSVESLLKLFKFGLVRVFICARLVLAHAS